MSALKRQADRLQLWFTAPDSPAPLGYARIALALFCMIQMAVIRGSILDVYGQYGFVQWAITRAGLRERLPHLGNLAILLRPLGLDAEASVWIAVSIYLLVLAALLVGWRTRIMAIAAWCLHFLFMHAGSGVMYGMDVFTHIGLFYLVFMPCGNAVSLDVLAGRSAPTPSVAAGVTRRMLQIHLSIIYVSSGLEKAAGIQWWNGEAIWRSVMMPVFHVRDMAWLAQVPWLAMLSGWIVLATEIGYGVFIWNARMRPVWLTLTIAMHLGIGVFLGMWLFAWIMILLNLAAFGWDVLRDAAVSRRRGFSRRAAPGALPSSRGGRAG